MKKYSIEGFYNYNGQRGALAGEIEVALNGSFESIITDCLSMFPDQMIKGNFQDEYRNTRMTFFKFPPSYNLANLVYRLEKPKTEDLAGLYFGEWSALPYKLEMHTDLNLIIARSDSTVCNTHDYAELILKQK